MRAFIHEDDFTPTPTLASALRAGGSERSALSVDAFPPLSTPPAGPSTSQAASGPLASQNAAIIPNVPVLTHKALEDNFMYYTANIIESVELEQPPFHVILCERYGLLSSITDEDELDVTNHADLLHRMHHIALVVKGRLPRVYVNETIALLDALAEDRAPLDVHSDLVVGRLRTRLSVRRFTLHERIFFIVCAPASTHEIWLHTATDVCHLIRKYSSTEPDLIGNIIPLGIPFSCPKQLPKMEIYHPTSVHAEATARLKGHVFNTTDYLGYISRRNNFMQIAPHSRAALRRGGILWRLAYDGLQFEAENRACMGPDEYAMRIGHVQVLGTASAEEEWYEDHITEEEEGCLIGKYLICTRKSASGLQQVAEVSWFPKENVWLAGRLGSAGYWTTEAEAWYRERLRLIHEDSAPPLSQTQWRDKLRRHAVTAKKVAGALERWSATLLP
ncbi:hypothetical protein OE88DRAFT_1171511 [Heliocybe sulcata]|uniref:Uncharacterized protein n=1 Tax=Heliocybe sulcata TaxID=5364 RepID=A0A5C3NAH4_9AGAM|nr:hypothetical protein OE88DRAFT_1171511 [Heliocybe sulcata]